MQIALPEGQCRALTQTTMPDGDEAEIFTERTYQIAGEGELRVIFPAPVPLDGGWCCHLRLEWPDGRVSRFSGPGYDRLDAILVATKLALINLENLRRTHGKDVTWVLGSDLYLSVELPAGVWD